MFISLASCTTLKNTADGLKKINDTCPAKDERSLKNIFCKEPN
jgi:hypothetical protein